MGLNNSSAEAYPSVKFEDQFDVESYIGEGLTAQDVYKLREAFEALAERQPNGELGVRTSTFNNIQQSSFENNNKKSKDKILHDDEIEDYEYIHRESQRVIASKVQTDAYYNDNIIWGWNRMEQSPEECATEPPKKKYIEFEEFVKIMKDKMLSEKNSMQGWDIVFESSSSNVSCLFWPY